MNEFEEELKKSKETNAYVRARITSNSHLDMVWSHHHGNYDVIFDLRGRNIDHKQYIILIQKIQDFMDDVNEGFDADHKKILKSIKKSNTNLGDKS